MGGAFLDDPVHRQRLGEVFEHIGAQDLTDHIPLDQAPRGRTDHHRVRRGQALQPGGNGGGLPHHERRALVAASHGSHQLDARMNPHLHRQPHAVVVLTVPVERSHPLDHP